ncbi:MAG: acyltransferase family protein [Nocardioides sp.]|uniref:acyltransferase family protein n=1 Tax=Nocardioides sp. TaxID=35761 RepID=UPI0023866A06|nr:acyltransferase family protein [Nocardioides sp.]MDE0776837.1 acyltransferase family protein [Nocardioides sp.]
MTGITTEGRNPPDEKQQSVPRLDIQGLRAIAVLAVFANHLWETPSGGFVGVDVFFVLSGFLITGLLVREQEKNGRVSISNFYRRRVKRIVPAATLVILFSIGATYIVFNSARGSVVRTDGAWSALFMSNWRFAMVGTDYWQTDGTVSPLQHFWSLAVEEQFYLFWPILIIFCALISRRRLLLASLALSIVLTSLLYSMWHSSTSPTWAYFSTFDRAWELGVGALLALSAQQLIRIPRIASILLGWVGFLGILASLFVVPQEGFPAPWALMPVIATGMVVAAGIGWKQRTLFPLTNPISRYVGDISYSLYLWHFPIIVIAKAYYPEQGLIYSLACIGFTFALAIASYEFVENPIRNSSWLDRTGPHTPARDHASPRRTASLASRKVTPQTIGLGVLALFIATMWSTLLIDDDDDPLSGDTSYALLTEREPADSPISPDPSLVQDIADATRTSKFPEFDIPLDELGITKWRSDLVNRVGCYDVSEENVESCVRGPESAKETVAVLGDSQAMAYMPGVVTALDGKNYRVQQLTLGQCPVWDTPIVSLDGEFTECQEHRDWTVKWLSENPVDIAILTTASSSIARLKSGAEKADASDEIAESLTRMIERIQDYAESVIVIPGAPGSVPLQECVTNVGDAQDCTRSPGDLYTRTIIGEQRAAQSTGATFVDSYPWFCTADGLCPGWAGVTPIRVDNAHLSIPFSERLGIEIAKIVKSTQETK